MMCHTHPMPIGHAGNRCGLARFAQSLWCAAILAAYCGCPQMQSKPASPTSRWVRITAESGSDSAGRHEQGITQHDFDQMKATIPIIMHVAAERHTRTTVSSTEAEIDANVTATTPGLLSLLNEASAGNVARGRFLTSEDVDVGAPVAVIDDATAKKLFPSTRPVGESISIENREFTVVGIFAYSKPSHMGDVASDVYIPLATLFADDGSAIQIDRIWLEVESIDQVEATQQIVRALLKRNHPEREFSITSNFLGREL